MSTSNFYSSGIYLLVFPNGDKYVGQAKDFDTRWRQHVRSLEKGNHTKLIQNSCTLNYGEMPKFGVLVRCHPDYLDYWERYYITTFRPPLNASIPPPLTVDEANILLATLGDTDDYCGLGSIMDVLGELGRLKGYKRRYNLLQNRWDDKVKLNMESLEGFRGLELTLGKYKDGGWGRLGRFLGFV